MTRMVAWGRPELYTSYRQDMALLNTRSKALQDVAWSVSVQHGPGNEIFRGRTRGVGTQPVGHQNAGFVVSSRPGRNV